MIYGFVAFVAAVHGVVHVVGLYVGRGHVLSLVNRVFGNDLDPAQA